MLVNEAIMDMVVGTAKFCKDYTGGMPAMGCPECNGETIAYVAQEPSPARRTLCACSPDLLIHRVKCLTRFSAEIVRRPPWSGREPR
jgi:hypothetical protein